LGELLQPARSGQLRINLAELRPEEFGDRFLAGRLVAAVHLERLVGNHGGQAIGILQLPGIDEAVVAPGARDMGAEEQLPNSLRELQLRHLAGVDVAAPLDSLDESSGFARRADQLTDELVVGLIVFNGAVEPSRDLLPAAVDVASAGVVVAE